MPQLNNFITLNWSKSFHLDINCFIICNKPVKLQQLLVKWLGVFPNAMFLILAHNILCYFNYTSHIKWLVSGMLTLVFWKFNQLSMNYKTYLHIVITFRRWYMVLEFGFPFHKGNLQITNTVLNFDHNNI